MNMKTREYRTLVIGVLTLLLVGLGCFATKPLTQATSVPPSATVAPPAATPVPPPVAPMPDEGEAANALEAQVITVYQAVSPAVVNITNRSYVYDIFMRAIPQEGSGSGFVYDNQGHIVTNYHVVENAEQLLVTLANGKVYEAKVVGTDPANDLAVLNIDAGEDMPAPMVVGDSDKLQVGQFVLAIGNPFGLEQTLTTGVISALGRVIQSPEDNRFIGEAIQTDAAINPQIISPSQASAGVGFAVSANTVQRVVPELLSRGYYPHPWLDAQLVSLTPANVKVFREAGMKIPVDAGLLVIEAVSGGPADQAGIRGGSRVVRLGQYQIPLDGDIIIAVNGEPVNNFRELTVYLETQTKVGDTVDMTIIRDGQQQTIPVTLGEQPHTQ
jgi:S1-C subfamily serine protease